MIVAPVRKDFGSQDIPITRMSAQTRFAENGLICCAAGRQKRLSAVNYWRGRSHFGNNTPRITALIPQINAVLFRGKAEKSYITVWMPLTLFLEMGPISCHFFCRNHWTDYRKCCWQNDIEGLRTVIHTLECHGFMENPITRCGVMRSRHCRKVLKYQKTV